MAEAWLDKQTNVHIWEKGHGKRNIYGDWQVFCLSFMLELRHLSSLSHACYMMTAEDKLHIK